MQSLGTKTFHSRNDYNARENGKYHNSVIEAMMFPLNSSSRVVSPGLHIILGIILNLYTMSLNECSLVTKKCKKMTAEINYQANGS